MDEVKTVAEMRQRYADAHSRLWGRPAAPTQILRMPAPSFEQPKAPPEPVMLSAFNYQLIDRPLDDLIAEIRHGIGFTPATRIAARYYGKTPELLSESRNYELVRKRHNVMWTVRAVALPFSMSQFGRLLGRDHSTILHSFKLIDAAGGPPDPPHAAAMVSAIARFIAT